LLEHGTGSGATGIDNPQTLSSGRAAAFHAHDLYGKVPNNQTLNNVLARACRRAGVDRFTPKQLRHSFFTLVRSLSNDQQAVDFLMQHRMEGTTWKYVKDSMPGRTQDIIAAVDAVEQAARKDP
jgi:integrase